MQYKTQHKFQTVEKPDKNYCGQMDSSHKQVADSEKRLSMHGLDNWHLKRIGDCAAREGPPGTAGDNISSRVHYGPDKFGWARLPSWIQSFRDTLQKPLSGPHAGNQGTSPACLLPITEGSWCEDSIAHRQKDTVAVVFSWQNWN